MYLITGSNGFLGENLKNYLIRNEIDFITYDKEDKFSKIKDNINNIEVIFHLAGVNRSEKESDFEEINFQLTKKIVDLIENTNRNIQLVFSSSIQAELDNPYGRSKKKAEDYILDYKKRTGNDSVIFRLPNLFGKWTKPNYNSVVGTWCYNTANNIPLVINDENHALSLAYIDDVIKEFMNIDFKKDDVYYEISKIYTKTLGEISKLLNSFKDSRETLRIPQSNSGFERALYGMYTSYLTKEGMTSDLVNHADDRGSFYEIFKTDNSGQISVSTTKPGITRGNHYHDTKTEKFVVISGKAKILMRDVRNEDVLEYTIDDSNKKIIDMPTGFTHNFTNIGEKDLIVLIWASEIFDQDNPDTYYMEV